MTLLILKARRPAKNVPRLILSAKKILCAMFYGIIAKFQNEVSVRVLVVTLVISS